MAPMTVAAWHPQWALASQAVQIHLWRPPHAAPKEEGPAADAQPVAGAPLVDLQLAEQPQLLQLQLANRHRH
jgi:hypothetical protein